MKIINYISSSKEDRLKLTNFIIKLDSQFDTKVYTNFKIEDYTFNSIIQEESVLELLSSHKFTNLDTLIIIQPNIPSLPDLDALLQIHTEIGCEILIYLDVSLMSQEALEKYAYKVGAYSND